MKEYLKEITTPGFEISLGQLLNICQDLTKIGWLPESHASLDAFTAKRFTEDDAHLVDVFLKSFTSRPVIRRKSYKVLVKFIGDHFDIIKSRGEAARYASRLIPKIFDNYVPTGPEDKKALEYVLEREDELFSHEIFTSTFIDDEEEIEAVREEAKKINDAAAFKR